MSVTSFESHGYNGNIYTAFHITIYFFVFQVIFDLFYDEASARDSEGLAAMKILLNSKQVKPKEIRKNFYAADLFLDKVLDSLLLEAVYYKLGVDVANPDIEFNKEDSKKAKLWIGFTLHLLY